MLRITERPAWRIALSGPATPPIASVSTSPTGPADWQATKAACDIVVAAPLPAACPDCPAGVSCAPCLPFSCPAGAPTAWHAEPDGKGGTVCVREATGPEKSACGGATGAWWRQPKYELAALAVFALGVLGTGIAVAYSRRRS